MLLHHLTHESGKLNLGDQFVSLRLIKEILEKHNNIGVIEETSNYMRCKIFRILRLFVAPWMGPYPIVTFQIDREKNETIINYDFFWPEYYLVGIGSIGISIFILIFDHSLRHSLTFLVVSLSLGGFLTYLDVKYYSVKILNKLRKL